MQLVLSLKPNVFVTKFLNSCRVLPVTYAFHIFMESRNTWDQWKQGVKDHRVSKEHHTKCSAKTKGSEMIYIFQEINVATGSNPHRVFFWYHYAIIHFFHIDHNAPCPPPPPKKKKYITIVFDFSWDDCNTEEKLETRVMQTFGGKTRCKVYPTS